MSMASYVLGTVGGRFGSVGRPPKPPTQRRPTPLTSYRIANLDARYGNKDGERCALIESCIIAFSVPLLSLSLSLFLLGDGKL